MNTLAKRLIEIINQPDPRRYAYVVGQRVRILKGVVEDGQTPKHWAGAIGTVLRCRATMMRKAHWYRVQHDNGEVCDFSEEEIDQRYARRSPSPTAQPEEAR